MDIKLLNVVSWGGNPLGPIVYSALQEMGVKYNLELIEGDNLFENYGIKDTPAMIINGDIVLEGGKVSLPHIKNIISKYYKSS